MIKWFIGSIVAVFIIISIFASISPGVLSWMNQETYYAAEITHKDTLTKESEDGVSSDLVLFAKDQSGESHTFEVVDTFFRPEDKFQSFDIFGALVEGDCYDIKVGGIRFGLISSKKNIITYKEVECKNE